MEVIMISGISGAGKSRAADILEDLGFYCVDNMPAVLIPRFAELCLATKGEYERVALVTDVRSQGGFEELFAALDEMVALGLPYKVLFMEATTETLVRRFKESRRRHPLDPTGRGLEEAIREEKHLLLPVRDRADVIIDTSHLTLGRLQRKLFQEFGLKTEEESPIHVNVVAFGFKYGVPLDSDMLLDVRFLPNPFYNEELRPKSGMDEEVYDFVLGHTEATEFLKHLEEMVAFLLPHYIEEGKRSLTISIGCTGGRHRSVSLSRALVRFIEKAGYQVELQLRDLEKNGG